VVKADADLLCECLNNSLVRWIVDLNFPGAAEYPKLWIRCEEEDDLKPLAERDKILVNEIGLPIPRRYFYETYAIPEPEGEEETVGGGAKAEGGSGKGENGRKTNGERPKRGDREFGDILPGTEPEKPRKSPLMQSFTPDQQAVEGLKRAVAPELQAAAVGMIDPILGVMEEADGFEDAKNRLMAAYADMDDAAATELLSRALFAADAWGRISAERPAPLETVFSEPQLAGLKSDLAAQNARIDGVLAAVDGLRQALKPPTINIEPAPVSVNLKLEAPAASRSVVFKRGADGKLAAAEIEDK
jgi:phage gp29-like protein